MDDRPRIVCLSGSSRFIDQMAVLAWDFEKRGFIALGCHLLPSWYGAPDHHGAEAEGVAEAMDELHLRKIDLADILAVVTGFGYIGESTKREIAYALAQGMTVSYYREDDIVMMMP